MGIFFICALDACRMDSSLVSRYLCAESLLLMTEILVTVLMKGGLGEYLHDVDVIGVFVTVGYVFNIFSFKIKIHSII